MSVSAEGVNEIAPQSGTAFSLAAGSSLRIIDPLGGQVCDLVAFDAHDRREVLSNGRTFDYNGTIKLTTGHQLYSNRSRVLLTIAQDDVAVHDFLLSPCSTQTWRICYGDEDDQRPGCLGNLARALECYGIGVDAIPTAFNVFMNVEMVAGKISVRPPRSSPGSTFEVKAERDLVVGLTACSAALSNGGTFKPIHYQIRGPEHMRSVIE